MTQNDHNMTEPPPLQQSHRVPRFFMPPANGEEQRRDIQFGTWAGYAFVATYILGGILAYSIGFEVEPGASEAERIGTIAGIIIAVILAVFFTVKKINRSRSQRQNVGKDGTGIQSGRDTNMRG